MIVHEKFVLRKPVSVVLQWEGSGNPADSHKLTALRMEYEDGSANIICHNIDDESQLPDNWKYPDFEEVSKL